MVNILDISKSQSTHNNKEGIMPSNTGNTPTLASAGTIPTTNQKESVMHKHLSIEDVFKDVPTNKEENEMVHTTEEKKGFRLDEMIDWSATMAHFDALLKRDAEEGEMHRLRKLELDAKKGLEETDRMIFTFFGRKFQMDNGFDNSPIDDGKDRNKGMWGTKTQMAMMWRARLVTFYPAMEYFSAVAKEAKHKVDKAFTQERQWEAQCNIMQGAYERKQERQAKHQARIEKMKAKKVDGTTPKQVKRIKRSTTIPVTTIPNIVMAFGIKSIMGSVKFQCTSTTKKGAQCKNKTKELAYKTCSTHTNKEV